MYRVSCRAAGTVLGTTNRDNPFHYAAGEDAAGNVIYEDRRDDVVRNLNAHGIECLIVIGGDGSLKIGYDLHRFCGVNVVGVPKTIDNDLPGTERTFGFDHSDGDGYRGIGPPSYHGRIPSPRHGP